MVREALASLLHLSAEPVSKDHQDSKDRQDSQDYQDQFQVDFSEVSVFDTVLRNIGRLLKPKVTLTLC